jgi:hypothetical protein
MQRIQQGKSLASSNQVINTSRNTETESSKLSAVYTEIPSNCSSRYTESSKAKVWPPRRWPASTAGCRIRPPHRQIRLPRHWIRPLGFRICYRRQQEREWGRGCTPPPRAPPLLSPAVAWAIGDPLKRRWGERGRGEELVAAWRVHRPCHPGRERCGGGCLPQQKMDLESTFTIKYKTWVFLIKDKINAGV